MGEKFRSLIERDIAIVLVLIICGLAFSGENGRGFPLPWLSGEGASTVAFLVDLAILGGLVVAIDIFTMIAKGVIRSGDFARSREIRKAYRARNLSLPKTGTSVGGALRKATGGSFSESSDGSGYSRSSSSDASVRQGPGQAEQDYLERMRAANREFEERSTLRNRQRGSRKKKGNPVIASVLAVFMLILTLLPVMTSFFSKDNGDGQYFEEDVWEDSDWMDYDSGRDEAVNDFCSETIDALANRDADWLDMIGTDGDSQALIGMTDWSTADFDSAHESNYYFSEGRNGLVRCYLVFTDDGPYWLALKFCESDNGEYVFENNNVALTGVAACPVPEWIRNPQDDEYAEYSVQFASMLFYNEVQLSEEDSYRLYEFAAENTEYIGENWAEDRQIVLMWCDSY